MLLGKVARGLVIVAALLGTEVAQSQEKIQAKPSEKLFTIRLADNSVIVADGISRRFYLQAANGGMQEMTFDDVVAHVDPDPAQRSLLLSRLENALARPLMEGYFESGEPLGVEPLPCEYPCLNPELPTAMMESVDGQIESAAVDEERPPHDLDGVSVAPRRPSEVPLIGGGGGVFWSGGFLGSYNPSDALNSSDPVTYQQYWKDDFRRFERARQAACSAATQKATLFALNLSLTVAACGLAVAGTPVGGVGPAVLGAACFAEGVLTVNAWNEMAEANAACAATYPGPGNWN